MAKDDNIGALWVKEGGRMSGYIEIDGKKTNIVLFVNTYKKEDKHPDYNILISKPREDRNDGELNNPNPEMVDYDAPPDEEEINPEDIPF